MLIVIVCCWLLLSSYAWFVTISFTKRIQVGSYTSKTGETKPLHHQIRFIDNFNFMATSLDNLVNNLPKTLLTTLKGITRKINLVYSLEKGYILTNI